MKRLLQLSLVVNLALIVLFLWYRGKVRQQVAWMVETLLRNDGRHVALHRRSLEVLEAECAREDPELIVSLRALVEASEQNEHLPEAFRRAAGLAD